MNLIRTCKGQLLLTLVLFLAILAMPFRDYTEREFSAENMNYPEDSIGIVSEEGGLLTVPDGAGHILLNSDDYYFKKGTYQVVFFVSSPAAGNTVEVYDPLYLNSDNVSGRVLAQADVAPGEDSVSLSFTVEDYVSCIQFRVQTDSALTFTGIHLLSQRGLYQDPYLYAGLLLLASALLLLYRRRHRIRPEILLLLAFAAVSSTAPMSFPWIQKGHDLYFHYGRLFNLSRDLFSGSLPVRIHSSLFKGFGYMSAAFYPEAFFYPFALLIRLGMSPIGCYKLLILCINFATAGVSYYSFSRLCRSRKLGLTASVFYILASYRLINLYTRSAIGEVLAAVFLPLLLLGIYQLFYGDSRKWWASVIAFTCIFQSHMISTELSLGFCVLFALLNIRRLKDRARLLHLLLAAGTTILLNLWSILPLFDLFRYPFEVSRDARALAGYGLYALQFFDPSVSSPVGEALGPSSITGEMPYTIGILLLAGSLLFAALCFRKNQKLPDWHKKLGTWCLALGLLSAYASSVYFPWEAIQRIELFNRVAGAIQFAFRFLPFATLFLCVTSAIAVYDCFTDRASRKLLFLGCVFFLTWTSGRYFGEYSNTAESLVDWNTQMDHVNDTDNLYMVTDDFAYYSYRTIIAQDVTFSASEGVALSDVSRDGTEASFTYEKTGTAAEAYVDVPFHYYPYYHAVDQNGNELATDITELLRLRVLLPEGSSGTVQISFEIPVLWRVGDAVSVITLCGLIALSVLSQKKRKEG